MISAEFLIPALLLLNVIPLMLLVLIRLKLDRESSRSIFAALVLFGMLWGDTTLLSRYDGLDSSARALILSFNFATAIILVAVFFAFFVHFTENNAVFRSPVFWIIMLNTAALAGVSFTDLIAGPVDTSGGNFRVQYGKLYPWFIASAVGVELYGLLIIMQTYRRSQNELLKFQLRTILLYCVTTFLLVNVMNIVLPYLFKTSRYSVIGPYCALLFFGGVFHILLRGPRLYAMNMLRRLISAPYCRLQDNLLAIREFLRALETAIAAPEKKTLSRVQFAGPAGEQMTLFLGKDALPEEAIPPAGEKGGTTLRLLEEDNRYLSQALIQAESVIREKWLAEVVDNIPVREIAPPTEGYRIDQQLPLIERNIAENVKKFGVEISSLSRIMSKQMNAIQDYAASEQLIVIEGEPGTGRTEMARAIHFYRTQKRDSVEIHCQNGNIDALARRIDEVAVAVKKSRKKTGVLIRNIDILPLDMVSIFTPIFDIGQDKVFLYITSAPDYLRNLEGLSDRLFHQLNQIRIQLPPLRRRDDDVIRLVYWYTARYAKKMNIPYTHISHGFLEEAKRLTWQGNITELKNTIQREILNNRSPLLSTFHLNDPHALAAPGQVLTPLERAERKVIVDYLKKNNFNKNRTRLELDITVNTLNAKIIKYGIELPE